MSLTAVHPGPGLGSDASTAGGLSAAGGGAEARYCAWFHDLDAWTEYWDVYQPQSRGRFYFGDGPDAPGLLPPGSSRGTGGRPALVRAWVRMALEASDAGGAAAAAGPSPRQ